MRVATYIRCSTTHHDQNPQVQVDELRRYCKAREWTITHEIIDHGYGGGTDARPGLKQLLSLVRSREIDTVVVVKLDRLFRSLRHLVTVLDEFDALGIQFVATKDNVDYTTPAGKFFIQILGSLAEFEKSLIRERTMLGLEHARATGKKLGRPKTRNDDAILKLRNEGLSYTEIQRRLGCERSAIYRALKAIAKTRSKASFQALEKTRHKKGG